ncbi:PilW family protein [Ectothiorhodospira mobilis]|nr:PilW family protein [Ectothiorhodospira mobilis]MCG5534647.1 PilW family protein [Ectothiorhodospira mobilis]
MIALALGLLLMLAVGTIFLAGKQSYRTNDALAEIQETGRFAMEFLRRGVRGAGGSPCGPTKTIVNVLEGVSTHDLMNFEGTAIMGYEDVRTNSDLPGSDPFTPRDPLDGTDAVLAISAEESLGFSVTGHNPTSAQFKLSRPSEIEKPESDRTQHDFVDGDILMVCDFDHTAIFQVTNANQSNLTVVHNTGVSGVTPGNCTKGLGSPLVCDTANGTPYTFGDRSRITRMVSRLFYIAENPRGVPSLYRAGFDGQEELVQGVQDMQMVYGRDTDGDGSVDRYDPANVLTGADWEDVVSVRISILVYSEERNVLDRDQTIVFNGSEVTPPDRRLGRVFTSTVALRNRL